MDVPEGWTRVTLSEALEEYVERAAHRSLDLPVLSVTKNNGIMLASDRFEKQMHSRNLEKYRVAPYDTIVIDPMLLWSGSVGRQTRVDAGLVSPDYRVFTARPTTGVDYLEHAVTGDQLAGQFRAGARGTNTRRNRISRADFMNLQIDLPPIGEQRKIAAILSSVDEAIEKTQAVIDQVQVVKKGLMQELLTRGLPGRHKKFKQTEIGEIPASWEVDRIGDVSRVFSGATPSRARAEFFTVSEGVPWVKTMDLNDGWVSQTSEKISQLALDCTSCRVHPPGTVLIAMYGGFAQIGRSGVLSVQAATNQAISAIRFGPGYYEPSFVNAWLVSARPRWRTIAASSRKDPNITRSDVLSFRLPRPPINEQREIVGINDAVARRLQLDVESVRELQQVKQALMSVLLTGELRVNPTP